MIAALSRWRPWSSAWVRRPKNVRSASTLTSASDSEKNASGLMVRIRAMSAAPTGEIAAGEGRGGEVEGVRAGPVHVRPDPHDPACRDPGGRPAQLDRCPARVLGDG